MWRRYPDATGATVLLIRVLLWVFLARLCLPQEVPTRTADDDAFGIDPRHLFYDTNAIPDGIEVNPYLFFNATKKFFYLLDTTVPKLDFTLTPCASPILWQVTHRKRSSDHRHELGKEADSAVVDFKPVVNTNDILYTFRGETAETLRLDLPREGIYTIEITSLNSDSYVQIFVSSSPDIERFPDLPADTRVREIDKKKDSFTVEWESSPDEQHFGDSLEYCIAVNRRRSFKTLCSVESHRNGDPKPTLPPGNGFGFSTDIYKKRLLKQNAQPIQAQRKGSIFLKCIGQNRKATFEKVKTRYGYYVDVFVKHTLTDGRYRSRQYVGTYVKTNRKRKFPKLKNGKTRIAKFTKRTRKITYLFYNSKSTRDLHLALSSCSGKVNVEIKGVNGTLLKAGVKGTKVLNITDAPQGQYLITIQLKTVRYKTSVHVSMVARKKLLKVPILPEDRTVKVFDNLSSCSSVTVAFIGTSTKQTYCLYKTEISKENSTSISQKLNECGAYSRVKTVSQKIMCKKFKYSKENAVLAITVTNLKSDTSYIFDVFVNRGKYFTFLYNSIRTKTSPSCYLPT
ncbi:protein NDNF-like [Dreissena polymorpha]|uniref:Protein NDNF n=1 Tax=Dreissena polymorpha TaxID=45954 RepID=A0A9D4M440_DREPO|nr:protein NDNF-like [Dreissena polymorpha]XP_052265510.1 protein NDNF-like [Dreissena polymorpha]KAH3869359.1 hypothetical protein DPMN_032522 [Dreissena polymorpha]